MASGYVTSDGKDLDQRYLAIGGKASSAGHADSAGSVHWNNVAGRPSVLSGTSFLQHSGASIKINTGVSYSKACTYTAPSSGYFVGRITTGDSSVSRLERLELYVNGHRVKDVSSDTHINTTPERVFFLRQGQTIRVQGTGAGAGLYGTFFPTNLA